MTTFERPFGRYLEDSFREDVYRHWPGRRSPKPMTIFLHDHHDHHPLHTNAWFAEQRPSRERMWSSGNLVYSLALGMSVPDVSGSWHRQISRSNQLLHRSPRFTVTPFTRRRACSRPCRRGQG